MKDMTTNDVVRIVDDAWRDNIIGKPLHDDLTKIGDDFAQSCLRHNVDFATMFAMMAALSATTIGALYETAIKDGFNQSNIDLIPGVGAELFRRALLTMKSH